MPSRPINQQATSGPAIELHGDVCIAERVRSCQQTIADESSATGREKEHGNEDCHQPFAPRKPPVQKAFLREEELVQKPRDHLLCQRPLAKS